MTPSLHYGLPIYFAQRGAHFGQGMGNGAMIAVKRLQSIFWVLLVTLGAIAVYLVSLRVATERTELARVDAQILSAKREIRYLETEFSARASMRQLERWRSEEHTSELQSLMRISYAVFC